jgi:hypothetical protein
MPFSDITSENSIMGVEKSENAGKSRKMSENVGKSRKNVGKSRKAGCVGGGPRIFAFRTGIFRYFSEGRELSTTLLENF